jgi:hypothetical protein
MNVDYTKSSKYDLVDWLASQRKRFKGIKPQNADTVIHVFTMVAPWVSNDQFTELYCYICNEFNVYKDENHYATGDRKNSKSKSK